MLKYFTAAMLFAGFSAGVMADDGASISVTGTVSASTCTVSPDSQSKEINLGNISARQFQRAGDGSPEQIFILNLEKCSPTLSNVTVTFNGDADTQNPDLLAIGSGAGAANGIAVAIYDQKRTLIPLNTASASYALQPDQTVALKFYARYLSTKDTVISGNATATTTFVLNYD